ncbi:MAG TPA: cation:proton antiporter [Anaerolineales bacterium]|jgi:CPA2 family monovalent cation:H+ antiporter-2|nr:cation:proton antiporter [Anaerolineales bacterium]HQX16577.1 cation:proton antiporter [Anaerolineales bacterium]
MQDISLVFIELGIAIIGLALLTRLASKWGFSAIPLYLLAGLAFGNGGILPLQFSEDFVHIGAEIGVILLLFMLGLEYTGEELSANLKTGLPAGIVDFLLNFPPGLITGLLLGWSPLAAVLLGGVTYISSSGLIAKVLSELGRLNNQETPTVISILVIEDLVMALYLPLVAVLLIGLSFTDAVISILIALATVSIVLFIALRYGKRVSQFIAHQSDEVILFTTFGLVLLVAGIAQRLQVSAAIGAFLVGIAISGSIAERTQKLLAPSRDLFAAIFFLFFGLQINPASLPPVLLVAVSLGIFTALTKLFTGWWSARRAKIDSLGSFRAGAALVARGEFSIVIAGLGVSAGLEPQLGALSAAYVLFMAILGPILARFIESLVPRNPDYNSPHET